MRTSGNALPNSSIYYFFFVTSGVIREPGKQYEARFIPGSTSSKSRNEPCGFDKGNLLFLIIIPTLLLLYFIQIVHLYWISEEEEEEEEEVACRPSYSLMQLTNFQSTEKLKISLRKIGKNTKFILLVVTVTTSRILAGQ